MLSLPDFQQKQILFAFLGRGEKISFKNDNIVILNDEGKIKHQSTCYRLFALFIVGHITVTSGLLERAERFGFTIVFLTYSLRPYGIWGAKTEGNVLLREKQYKYLQLDIAKHLVENKIQNQILTLNQIRKKNYLIKDTIEKLSEYQSSLASNKLLEDKSLELKSLLGREGVASRLYFKALFNEIGWNGRKPRVKADTINCLLDIGYTMLFCVMEALLNVYGFDLYKGVYHQTFYQRKSLVCDFVEPFRVVLDARIKKAYNLGQVKEEDFIIVQKQYRLFGEKAKPYVGWMLDALLGRKEEMFIFVQQYYRAFMKGKMASEFPVFKIV